MKKKVVLAAATSLLSAYLIGGVTQAHDWNRRPGWQNAHILRVEPMRRTEVIQGPDRQVCRTEAFRRGYSGGDNIAGTLIGAVVGGVMGNQFGGGNGRAVATAIGAVAGAAVGQRMSENAYPGYDRGVAYRQVCRTVPGIRHVRVRTEYRITYRNRGEIHQTVSPYPPSARVPVHYDNRW